MAYRDLEPAIRQIGLDLYARLRARRRATDRVEQRFVEALMAAPGGRARLFQLVDTFPALDGADEVYQHVMEYLDDPALPGPVRRLVRVAARVPRGEHLGAAAARLAISHMATRFIAGTDAAAAAPAFEALWRRKLGVIVDILGEKTITDRDADRYAARVAAIVNELGPDRAGEARGRRSIAIKPTALAPRFDPLTEAAGLAEARIRLAPILRAAIEHGLLVWFDMEQHRVKDLTVALFRSCLEDGELAGLRAGLVVQAYLRHSERDLVDLLEWAGTRPDPIAVRLVKGAYWDAETVVARAHGWPMPVFDHKAATDANYERCTRLLLEHRHVVHPAFASHNIRSIAHAIAAGDALGVDRGELELQMLYGMEGGLADAARSIGPLVDVYAPTGELVPGMAYLVRRLLENSSNESFVRQVGHVTRQSELAELLAAPEPSEVAA
jgi:RHH-type proline utilization regulon transcriptional repressor/proline dehydrogenase/delta 1-pyrroline-5-carboxylate dehydrogenase